MQTNTATLNALSISPADLHSINLELVSAVLAPVRPYSTPVARILAYVGRARYEALAAYHPTGCYFWGAVLWLTEQINEYIKTHILTVAILFNFFWFSCWSLSWQRPQATH